MPDSVDFSFITSNVLRIWCICKQDKRMRAAAISYIVPSIWIALCERFEFFNENNVFSVTPLLRIFGLALAVYIFAGPQQYIYSVQGFVLGLTTGSCINIGLHFESFLIKIFCTYVYFFATFHFSEFFVTGLTNLDSLKPDSFLFNHSTSYWIAAIASWVEFAIEGFLFPKFYSCNLWVLGIMLCISGEIIRKLAMCHASNGFTHQIAVRRLKNHALVTDGVYAYCRHPGYLGWFLWSTGTQIILCNPICIIVYASISYQFFSARIYEEERYLVEFFGQRYIAYQQQVPAGFPRVKGFA